MGNKVYLVLLMLMVLTHCQFNLTLSKVLDKYSGITHCTEQEIRSWECKICKQVPKPESLVYVYNQQTHILGYVGYLRDMGVFLVVWRGTIDIVNWLEDFAYEQIKYQKCGGCLIHAGFYLTFQSVSGPTFSAIESLNQQFGHLPIIITGSSLGGALGLISALELQARYSTVQQAHVFGCPRIGNDNLAQYLQIRIPSLYRVVHSHDIIPHVPYISMGFFHPPTQVLFDKQMMTYKVCSPSNGEDPTCSNAFAPNFTIIDHVTYWTQPTVEDICTLELIE